MSEHQDALNKLLASMDSEPPASHANGRTPLATVAGSSPPITDSDVIDLCRSGANAPKFADLYDHGNTGLYDGDESRTDHGLINLLYFYTQDPEQIDRIMRGSALARPKFDRDTAGKPYLRYSIDNAIAKNIKEGRETYTPSGLPSEEISGSPIYSHHIHGGF